MKVCTSCKRDLPAIAFSGEPRVKGGLRSRCRMCRRAEVKAHTAAHLPEKRKRDKARRESKRDVLSAQRRAWDRAHTEEARALRAASEARYPERVAARKALRDAVAAGRVRKLPCAVCGATDRIHGHHTYGYDVAHWFDVMWLCGPHHRLAHSGAALAKGEA